MKAASWCAFQVVQYCLPVRPWSSHVYAS